MAAPGSGPLIEIGWVLVGPLEPSLRRSIEQAMEQFLAWVRRQWPELVWRNALLVRRGAPAGEPVEAVSLLDIGMAELDAAHWDFAFVITDRELRSYEKPFAIGAPARSYGVAVLSTARLEPVGFGGEPEAAPELPRRLFALAVHELGHLNGLDHVDEASDFMFDLNQVSDLDRMRQLAPFGHLRLGAQLAQVADLRVEEQVNSRSASLFYLRAIWANRRQILSAVAGMRPWAFPLRLSRLTTAALSTMVIFLITAEAWELGMSQSPLLVLVLSLFALAATSVYILKRQRLIERLRTERFSEQRVLSNVSMVAAVFLGMFSTYALLFATTLLGTQIVFSPAIVRGWTGLEGGARPGHYAVLSGFIAAVGILIGALGASFESEGYFRHVALVDEET